MCEEEERAAFVVSTNQSGVAAAKKERKAGREEGRKEGRSGSGFCAGEQLAKISIWEKIPRTAAPSSSSSSSSLSPLPSRLPMHFHERGVYRKSPLSLTPRKEIEPPGRLFNAGVTSLDHHINWGE